MANSRSTAARVRQEPADTGSERREMDEVDIASADSMDASDPPSFGGVTGVGTVEESGDERQRRISERAHELWREAGSPDGAALEYWLTAEREIDDGSGYAGASE